MAGSLLVGASAWGSADSSCYPQWKLKQTDLSECSSSALMGPGNDTRVNMLMLLFDRHGATGISTTPYYDYGYDGRRGEAEPFDYPLFAQTLGGAEKREEGSYYRRNAASRCQSNDSGMVAFKAALNKAKGIPSADATKLVAAREALNPQCESDSPLSPAVTQAVFGVRSDTGQLFARYLVGAAGFYDGDYLGAEQSFTSLAKAKDAWVAEAASYMIGRSALNEAMTGAFDEYGGMEDSGANKRALAAAEVGFLNYLKAYPKGQYAASARGLMRKIYWLGGDRQKLLAEYLAAFDAPQTATGPSLADLVQEFDIKLLSGYYPTKPLGAAGVNDAVTLAVIDLRAMRQIDTSYGGEQLTAISRAELERQKPRFAGHEDLYGYVLAAHSYYVANKPADVLKLIPAERSNGSYLSFSRQLLRALALDATGGSDARAVMVGLVRAAKHPFQRGAAELAIAMHDERHKGVDNVFAANSVVSNLDIREILLRYHAGPELLRKQAGNKAADKRERDVATYTLLYKQLTRGFYRDFINDLPLAPANAKPRAADDYISPSYTDLSIFTGAIKNDSGFQCAPVRGVATSLANNPKDAAALLCLGDFARTNGLDPDFYGVSYALDTLPPKDELGGTPSLFPGKPFARGDIYKQLIADPTVSANNKAYALYRAVNCYGPSAINGCGGEDVPQATRKAWFNRLKSEYAATSWAKKQKYYW